MSVYSMQYIHVAHCAMGRHFRMHFSSMFAFVVTYAALYVEKSDRSSSLFGRPRAPRFVHWRVRKRGASGHAAAPL